MKINLSCVKLKKAIGKSRLSLQTIRMHKDNHGFLSQTYLENIWEHIFSVQNKLKKTLGSNFKKQGKF